MAKPNFDAVDQQRQDTLVITAILMTAVAAISVILRCLSRFVLLFNPGLDDYMIILTIGYDMCIVFAKTAHVGFPMALLTPDDMRTILKAILAIQALYYTIVTCIKTSILFTYLRLAVSDAFRRLCIGTIALHTVFFVISIVVTLLQCRPLSKIWDQQGSRINTMAFFSLHTRSRPNPFRDAPSRSNLWSVIEITIAVSRAQRQRSRLAAASGSGGGGGGGGVSVTGAPGGLERQAELRGAGPGHAFDDPGLASQVESVG
ncbi:integral membrane protein [Xylariomycetidae sp. FL2044]|nr:integral membrane protein [Xylariomycetidae sp. FL2044]